MNEFNDKKNTPIFSKKVRAGKKRTYFFDVKTTRSNDYFLTITESIKKLDGEGYERHKIFLYKEDFNKFTQAFNEVINHIKGELMPDFDFTQFDKDENFNADTHQETKHFDNFEAKKSDDNSYLKQNKHNDYFSDDQEKM
ncbi:MAG: DUF3276 family protein [Phycisphaerales bacterium]|nr:DUF3276 family protein [Phycisphaerales bacterium]